MPVRSPYPQPIVLCVLLLCACTNDPEDSGDPTPDSLEPRPTAAAPAATVAGTAASPNAAPPTTPSTLDTITRLGVSSENSAAFRELMGADWEIQPGTERYFCVRLTLTETLFVNTWGMEAPFGTHHILFTMSSQPDAKPDGVSECDAATFGPQLLFVAGVGTGDYKLPSGVAMKLPEGGQALLNLHLFNPTDKPLRGRSGVRIEPFEEENVRDLADILNVLTLKIDVPPGRSTTHAKCTLDRDATIIGVGPHMHEKGVAMQAVAHTALHGDVMLFDGPYDFEDQQGYPVGPLQLNAGDVVDVACIFENHSGTTLHFGDSSTEAEMCSLGLVRYPAGGPSNCAK